MVYLTPIVVARRGNSFNMPSFRALEGAGGFEDKFKFSFERQVAEGLIQGFVAVYSIVCGARHSCRFNSRMPVRVRIF